MSQDIHVSWSGPTEEKPTVETMKHRSFTPHVTDVIGLARAIAEGRSVIGNYTGQKKDGSLSKNGRITSSGRRSQYWLSTQTVCIDCDDNSTDLSLDEIVARLPLRPHIAYRTMSCPEDRDLKFRLVYVLDEPVTDWGDYCRIWTVVDRQFRDATGLLFKNKPLKNGCAYGSDWAMKTATCVIHGCRKGSPMIVAPDLPPLSVGSETGLISQFYDIFGGDPVYNKEYFKPQKNLSFCAYNTIKSNKGQRPAPPLLSPYIRQIDRFFEDFDILEDTFDRFRIKEYWNPSKWPEKILKTYGPGTIIRKSEIGSEYRDPLNPNIRYVPNDGEYWRIEFPRMRIRPGSRMYAIKSHVRKCLICEPSADTLKLVVNGLYFMNRNTAWRDGNPIHVQDVIDAVIDVMEEDRGDWDIEELFRGSRRPRFSVDVWGEFRRLGFGVDREDYMKCSEGYRKFVSDTFKHNRNRIQGRLCGQARRELNYRELDKVYNPLYPVGWNMKNIEERWPDVPHSRNTLKGYCESRGIDPMSTKGGRPRKDNTQK